MPIAKGPFPSQFSETDIEQVLSLVLKTPGPMACRVAVFVALNSSALEMFVSRLLAESRVANVHSTALMAELLRQGCSDAVVRLAVDSLWPLRQRAMRILIEEGDESHLDIAQPLVNDTDKDVRADAVRAVEALSARKVMARHRAVLNEDELVLLALVTGRSLTDEACGTLVQFIVGNEALPRKLASQELLKHGRHGEEALIRALDAPSGAARDAAMTAMRELHQANAGPLLDLLPFQSHSAQLAMLDVLAEIRELRALPILWRRIASESASERLVATKLVAAFSTPETIQFLRGVITTSTTGMKLAAIKGIRRFRADKLLPLLMTALSDNDAVIRMEAFSAIRDVIRHRIFGYAREEMFNIFYEAAFSDAERSTLDEIAKELRPTVGIDAGMLGPLKIDAPRETRPDEWTPTATVAQLVTDAVWFSVTAPAQLEPGSVCLLDVWAYGPRQNRLVLALAREAASGRPIVQRGMAPVSVASGAQLNVVLEVPDFEIQHAVFNLVVGGRNRELLI